MTITILPEGVGKDGITYRAISGALQSEGKTAGEALDALAMQLNDEDAGTLVIVQSLRSDRFFTAQQQERLSELMTRWRSARDANDLLSAEEEAELEELVETELKAAASRALGASEELKQQARAGERNLLEEADVQGPFGQVIGNTAGLKNVLEELQHVAPTDAPVLLLGEGGVGKAFLARAIHHASQRAGQPLIEIDFATLAADLLGGEVLGYETDASEDADRIRTGVFQMLHRGTLVLDGMDQLAPRMIAKVLRILREGEFQRSPRSSSEEIDVRVILTMRRDLYADLWSDSSGSDFFHEFGYFVDLTVPPLRERREDIPLLVRHFLQQSGARMEKQFDELPSSVLDELQQYDWPGNVRELETLMRNAVILGRGGTAALGAALKRAVQVKKQIYKRVVQTNQGHEGHSNPDKNAQVDSESSG